MRTKFTALLLFTVMTINAQDAKFEKAILKNLEQMESAKTPEDWQAISNGFERIAGAEQNQWLAQYYAGFSNILTGVRQSSNDKKDEYYDKALTYINKADALQPDNSEIYVLKSWVLGMKIGVDPMNRGQQLGPEAGMLSARAKELDEENPRVYYLMGQSAMYTPAQFGGRKEHY